MEVMQKNAASTRQTVTSKGTKYLPNQNRHLTLPGFDVLVIKGVSHSLVSSELAVWLASHCVIIYVGLVVLASIPSYMVTHLNGEVWSSIEWSASWQQSPYTVHSSNIQEQVPV